MGPVGDFFDVCKVIHIYIICISYAHKEVKYTGLLDTNPPWCMEGKPMVCTLSTSLDKCGLPSTSLDRLVVETWTFFALISTSNRSASITLAHIILVDFP